jgi:hypothetical protein
MAKTVHFKLNASTMTACRNYDKTISVNINWNKVTCTECLMMRGLAKTKRGNI